MSDKKRVGWARNVFMAVVVLGGVSCVQSTVSAADASSTDMLTPTTTEAVATVAALQIQEQEISTPVNEWLRTSLHAEGGVAPYRWSLLSSELPDGVSLNVGSEAVLWGTPTRAGQFAFTVQVADALGTVVTKKASLNVVSSVVYFDPAAPTTTPVLVATTTPPAQSAAQEVIFINLDEITESEIQLIVNAFPDTSPLIYVNPDATGPILRANIAQMRIKPHGLYRVEGGTPSTVNEAHTYSDVYYIDPSGRRHAFSTEESFKSWYADEPVIETVPAWKLSNIQLGETVTYRPGTFLRLEGTRDFYRVLPGRTLKKFESEATYRELVPTAQHQLLLLAQVADYKLDAATIKTLNDVSTLGQLPTQPGEEMN